LCLWPTRLPTSPTRGEVPFSVCGTLQPIHRLDTSPLMGEASEACRFRDLAKLGGGGAAGCALAGLPTAAIKPR